MPLLRIYLLLALFLLLGMLLTWFALRGLLNKRFFRGAVNFLLALALLGMFASGLLLLSTLYTYQRLSEEAVVASLTFEALGPQRYQARLTEHTTPEQTRRYLILGDDWQLDARIIKWHSFGTLLGLDPLYRLERFSGRYASPEQETASPRSIHSLSRQTSFDILELARYSREWLPLLDAYYGNAAYMPMANGAEYTIILTHNGLIARAGNSIAETALKNWK